MCISGGKKSSFLKIWRALLSCYRRFEICHFTDDIQVKRCPTSILTWTLPHGNPTELWDNSHNNIGTFQESETLFSFGTSFTNKYTSTPYTTLVNERKSSDNSSPLMTFCISSMKAQWDVLLFVLKSYFQIRWYPPPQTHAT